MEDYYFLLGICRDATAAEIKRVFWCLARELHPDVNSHPEDQERFKKITQAYEVLSDTGKRQTYDEGLDPLTGHPFSQTYAPRPPTPPRPQWSPPPPPPPRPPTPPRPQWPPRPSRRPRATWKKVSGVAAATLALVIIAVVSLIVASPGAPASSAATPPASTSPNTTSSVSTSSAQASETAQAAQINSLLNDSAATTKPMATALQDVRECYAISSAIPTIKAVADRYRWEYYQAYDLNTGQLPNGAALKNDLIKAFASSAWADLYFVEWAQQRDASGCAGSAAAAYNLGTMNAAKANTAKTAFVHLWNPVATSNGLPSRSAADI